MTKFALGIKKEMTQVFDEKGHVHAATILEVEPMRVTQVKTTDRDKYNAVQIGAVSQKEHRMNKAQKPKGNFRYFREFSAQGARLPDGQGPASGWSVGDTIGVSVFEPGDLVEVVATSKGKGFQGVVKRHGFHGGRRSHGQKHSEREPGSIGATAPQRVFKGTRMPGRMGGERVTVKNLRVLQVDGENQLLVISGAIPGRRGTLVEVRSKN